MPKLYVWYLDPLEKWGLRSFLSVFCQEYMSKSRRYSLIQRLSDGNLHRAEDLAHHFNVSVRTIYRDMQRLMELGVDITGKSGTGYRAGSSVTLPPMNLTMAELEALHLGLAIMAQGGEQDIQEAARSLADKIDALLAEGGENTGHFAAPLQVGSGGLHHRAPIQSAIRSRQRLRITVGPDIASARPLALEYLGRVWRLIAWNETTEKFASWRLDEISHVQPIAGLFVDEAGKTLADYRRK